MSTVWRSHRFVPLSELVSSEAWRRGLPTNLPPGVHASIEEGFQQGMERGYREGYANGEREGRASGFEQGLAEGRAQGEEAARAEARERLVALAAPIDAMRAALAQLQEDYQTALRREVVDLVAKVARQVIRCELALQPAQILALVDETLATMPRSPDSSIEVYLNPGDLQRIVDIDHERPAHWHLLPDARLEPGECRVRSAHHEADAGCRQRLSACMEQITEQLLPREEQADGSASDPKLEDAA